MAVEIDIRNAKTLQDLKQKETEYFRLLKLRSDLNKQYDEAVKGLYQNKKLDVTPLAPQRRSIQEELQDMTLQRQIAFDNLKGIMVPIEAEKVMSRLSLEELQLLNNNFQRLIQELKGRKNIDDVFFRVFFERFKELLARTRQAVQIGRKLGQMETGLLIPDVEGSVGQPVQIELSAQEQLDQDYSDALKTLADQDPPQLDEIRNLLRFIESARKAVDPVVSEAEFRQHLNKIKSASQGQTSFDRVEDDLRRDVQRIQEEERRRRRRSRTILPPDDIDSMYREIMDILNGMSEDVRGDMDRYLYEKKNDYENGRATDQEITALLFAYEESLQKNDVQIAIRGLEAFDEAVDKRQRAERQERQRQEEERQRQEELARQEARWTYEGQQGQQEGQEGEQERGEPTSPLRVPEGQTPQGVLGNFLTKVRDLPASLFKLGRESKINTTKELEDINPSDLIEGLRFLNEKDFELFNQTSLNSLYKKILPPESQRYNTNNKLKSAGKPNVAKAIVAYIKETVAPPLEEVSEEQGSEQASSQEVSEEQALREQALREQAQKEQAQKEQALRERLRAERLEREAVEGLEQTKKDIQRGRQLEVDVELPGLIAKAQEKIELISDAFQADPSRSDAFVQETNPYEYRGEIIRYLVPDLKKQKYQDRVHTFAVEDAQLLQVSNNLRKQEFHREIRGLVNWAIRKEDQLSNKSFFDKYDFSRLDEVPVNQLANLRNTILQDILVESVSLQQQAKFLSDFKIQETGNEAQANRIVNFIKSLNSQIIANYVYLIDVYYYIDSIAGNLGTTNLTPQWLLDAVAFKIDTEEVTRGTVITNGTLATIQDATAHLYNQAKRFNWLKTTQTLLLNFLAVKTPAITADPTLFNFQTILELALETYRSQGNRRSSNAFFVVKVHLQGWPAYCKVQKVFLEDWDRMWDSHLKKKHFPYKAVRTRSKIFSRVRLPLRFQQ